MIPADQDPGILQTLHGVPCTATTLLDCLGPGWGVLRMRTDVPALHTLSFPWRLALLSLSLPLHPTSLISQVSHHRQSVSQGSAGAGHSCTPDCMRTDGQTDGHARPPGSWLLFLFLFLMHEPGLAGWLAGWPAQERGRSLVRIPRLLVYDATKISLSQSQEPNLNVSRLQWYL